ncbi:phospholipid phosphatase 3-like [Ptychodera flava]|uniref:phospholipid phosphatase 3-like n=1 Tax=Ptychodera flava TaxID=63121 RepID=UPI003969ED3E
MADIRPFNVFLDFVIFCGVGALVAIPYYYNLDFLPVLNRGFRCDDANIRYPLKTETVPELYMLIGIAALIVFFLLGEILFYCIHMRKMDPEHQRCMPCGCTVHPIVANIYKMVGLYLFGAAVTYLFTLLVKRMVGSLRPNFMELCVPDYNCSSTHQTSSIVFDYECTGKDGDRARESFPSNHASSAFFCLVFVAMYFEGRLKWRSARLVKPLLQCACLMGATAVALSRVYDFYNFVSDVIAGALLGAGIAILVAYYLADLFRRRFSMGGHFAERDSSGVEMSNYIVGNQRTSPSGNNWAEYTM